MKKLHIALLMSLLMVSYGCLEEEGNKCFVNRAITVRVAEDTRASVDTGDVSSVILYIFDSSFNYMHTVYAKVGVPVPFNIPVYGSINMVAWGNLYDGMQQVVVSGTDIDSHSVQLLAHPAHKNGHASPGNLFYGQINVPAAIEDMNTIQSGEITLPVYHAVGSATVTLRNIKMLGGDGHDYRIVVHETVSAIDFNGNTTGSPAAYYPGGVFTGTGSDEVYFVPAFNIIPGTKVIIDIYHNSELLATVDRDSNGNPITMENGALANILIDCKDVMTDGMGRLSVKTALTPWGEYKIWKDF